MKKINMPNEVTYILDTLIQNNYEAYIVGGCVRDFIMGITPHDWDITTSATPVQIKSLFNKTFDTGIAHGTITVVLNKKNYEVTTYRIDGIYEDNRRPSNVTYTTDITEDLKRRDFTINAIAYNHQNGYIDPYRGIYDIKDKIIKGVGTPSVRFEEDALRMLRAIRFSATTNFIIEPETLQAIKNKNYLLKNISVERIREELTKLLLATNSDKLNLLVSTKLIYYFDESLYNYLDKNGNYIAKYIINCDKTVNHVYSLLLINSTIQYATKVLTDLKFDNKTIKEVPQIIEGVNENTNYVDDISYQCRKLISKYGVNITKTIIEIKKLIGINYESLLNEYELAVNNDYPLSIKDLSINGTDLKKIGVSNGVDIGLTLNYLLDSVLKNPELNSYDELVKLVQKKTEN